MGHKEKGVLLCKRLRVTVPVQENENMKLLSFTNQGTLTNSNSMNVENELHL